MVVGIGVKKVVETLDLPLALLFKKLQGITDMQMLIGCIVFTIAATLLSLAISVKIINRPIHYWHNIFVNTTIHYLHNLFPSFWFRLRARAVALSIMSL